MDLTFTDHGHNLALHNILQSIAKQRRITAYLEVGVCYGHSLAAILKEQFPNRLALCDTWGGEYGGEQFGGPTHIEVLLQEKKYTRPVTYLNGSSHDLLKKYIGQFDLITVDGDHSAVGAREDLEDCWKLLLPGGLLVFDDLTHPSHPELITVYRDFIQSVDAQVVHEDMTPMGVGVLCKTS
jgi:predicted O-methyltransferase YrrM